MWKENNAEREGSKTQGDRDTGRLMGEETEKCEVKTAGHRATGNKCSGTEAARD